MTLYVINRSSAITMAEILRVVPSTFGWVMAPDIELVEDNQGIFGNNPQAVYITDDDDTKQGYYGATYVYGAATIYSAGPTIRMLGDRLGKWVVSLRVWHEVLHHYNQPADDMKTWLESRPILRVLNSLSHPHRWVGSYIQYIYYSHLQEQINPDTFDEENKIYRRTYRGALVR